MGGSPDKGLVLIPTPIFFRPVLKWVGLVILLKKRQVKMGLIKSLAELALQQKALRKQINTLVPGSKGYNEARAELSRINNEIIEGYESLKKASRNGNSR